jgi:hypothetical protein
MMPDKGDATLLDKQIKILKTINSLALTSLVT